jgi:hypothetical protein
MNDLGSASLILLLSIASSSFADAPVRKAAPTPTEKRIHRIEGRYPALDTLTD